MLGNIFSLTVTSGACSIHLHDSKVFAFYHNNEGKVVDISSCSL